MTEETREMPESIYPVTPRQKALYDAVEGVAELFGKFDQGTGPDGAHYVAESPFDGMVCSSCVLYEGARGCEVVDGDIAPEGVCKLWIIPEALMPGAESEGTDTIEPVRPDMTVNDEYRRTDDGLDVPEVEHRRLADVELRMDGDVPVLEGYALVYEYRYDIGGGPEDGGFTEVIARGAAAKSAGEADVRLLVNHDGVPLARSHAIFASTGSSQGIQPSVCSMRLIAAADGGGKRIGSGVCPTKSLNSTNIWGHVLK